MPSEAEVEGRLFAAVHGLMHDPARLAAARRGCKEALQLCARRVEAQLEHLLQPLHCALAVGACQLQDAPGLERP